ncbi:hypothetical protein NECID01_1218 [Nematocida sp. AWRm77]|nr:hypothetical protein NECID01_1218 [Nematocida sp. AWRm77]
MESSNVQKDEPKLKQELLAHISVLLDNPTEKALGAVKKAVHEVLKAKGKGSMRFIVLALAKVFYNLLPAYNICTNGYKYNTASKTNAYEYLLMEEWQAYLKRITRSQTKESYEAAAILLPHTVLFNKSGKLVGKVVKGTGLQGEVGKKCRVVLKKMFTCDKGNRIVKILEVVNQMGIENIPKGTLKALPCIADSVLEKPVPTKTMESYEMRGLSVEEKAVQKEAQLNFFPKEMKAWKGINERLLRIYLLIISQKKIENYMFAIEQLQRLRVPGNLQEGIFIVLTQKIAELKKELTPARVAVMSECYRALHTIFGKRLEFSFQIEEFERIPLEILVQMDRKEIQKVYLSLSQTGKHEGSPALIKLLLTRGMHTVDPDLGPVIKHLMPREGPKGLEKLSPDGFWEVALLSRAKGRLR